MGAIERAIFVVTAAAVALAGCGKSGGSRSGAPPIAVNVAQAQRGDIATYIALDGQIAPMQQSTLSTPQSGTLAAVYVTEGTRVTRGQLLAKIDDSALRAQLEQAEGQVTQAQAALQGQTLQNPITSQTVNSAVTTAEQTLNAAKNTLISDQAAETNAKLVYTQNKELLGQGYVSQTSAEQSRSAYVAAQQATANARTQVTASQAALESARRNLGQTGIQTQTVAGAKGTLQSQQGQVKLLQTEIAQTSLIAPFTGVITQRLLDPGAFAGPNAPILQVSQIDTVYVNVNVPDDNLGYVRKGTAVTFTSSSTPGKTFRGSVYDVNATPTTGTLSYRARLVVPEPRRYVARRHARDRPSPKRTAQQYDHRAAHRDHGDRERRQRVYRRRSARAARCCSGGGCRRRGSRRSAAAGHQASQSGSGPARPANRHPRGGPFARRFRRDHGDNDAARCVAGQEHGSHECTDRPRRRTSR